MGWTVPNQDSVENAYSNHHYPRDPTPEKATALALTAGQCDINSGDTYNNFLLKAVAQAKNKSSGIASVTMKVKSDFGLSHPVLCSFPFPAGWLSPTPLSPRRAL